MIINKLIKIIFSNSVKIIIDVAKQQKQFYIW